MKKTRYTEEQIAFALKQALGWRKCAERWAFLKPLFTTGRKSLAGWA
jgi:putative transposase